STTGEPLRATTMRSGKSACSTAMPDGRVCPAQGRLDRRRGKALRTGVGRPGCAQPAEGRAPVVSHGDPQIAGAVLAHGDRFRFPGGDRLSHRAAAGPPR
ncbi:hypothetical protein, partial [Streptomyces sp. NPDC006999]|uniref:hypothetical protein n=1 Tax=Streptomyces sp. NPDC006999 TaxID=3156909 RepID=UPI0033E4B38D